MLKLREELVSVEEERLLGNTGYSVDQVSKMMNEVIEEVVKNGRNE